MAMRAQFWVLLPTIESKQKPATHSPLSVLSRSTKVIWIEQVVMLLAPSSDFYFGGAVWAHTKCTVLVARAHAVLLGWDNLVLGIV
jgi:hypothetical protein